MLVSLTSNGVTGRLYTYLPSMEQYDLVIDEMSCTGCEETVSNAIRPVGGAHRMEVEWETGAVGITVTKGNGFNVEHAIHETGYDITA